MELKFHSCPALLLLICWPQKANDQVYVSNGSITGMYFGSPGCCDRRPDLWSRARNVAPVAVNIGPGFLH